MKANVFIEYSIKQTIELIFPPLAPHFYTLFLKTHYGQTKSNYRNFKTNGYPSPLINENHLEVEDTLGTTR